MSRSREPGRYPLFCYKIIQDLEARPTQPIVLDCLDYKEAKNLQMTFNAFKRAALDAGWDNMTSKNYRGIRSLSQMVARFKNEDGKFSVEFLNINTDSAVSRWNAALGLEPPQDKEDPPAYADVGDD